MTIIQLSDQPVDVTSWGEKEEFEPYPEGARVKTLVYAPAQPPFEFLKSNHQYLFKLSRDRCPEQFWNEIFAYRLGLEMDVPVPPAFVAYDDSRNQSAALIEWFLSLSGNIKEDSESGGDLCQQMIPDFDRDKGRQHNFETLSEICLNFQRKYPSFNFDWKTYWAKVFLFDALIGNTDRHQNNWAIIRAWEYNEIESAYKIKEIRFSPVFDNGTSMGYEFTEDKFKNFNDKRRIEVYVSKGRHHIKWGLGDAHSMQHNEMLVKLTAIYPETRQTMLNCLNRVSVEIFEKILQDLTKFDVSVKLTPERANFMLKLLSFRHQRLLNELNN